MNAISTLNSAPTQDYARQFRAETGWNWNDAVDMAIECANEAGDYAEADRLAGLKLPVVLLNIDVQPSFAVRGSMGLVVILDEEIAKGWTYADAVKMASEIQRERRIFGGRGGRNHGSRNRDNRLPDASLFENETGWKLSDAIDEAAACRREHRRGENRRNRRFAN